MDTNRDLSRHGPSEIANDDRLRSAHMRQIFIRADTAESSGARVGVIPRELVQFWDDAENVPADVQACIDTWAEVETSGFQRKLFDDKSARQFIADHLGARHRAAFDICPHPAMRADYFRLCYISQLGGVYIDADDEYQGVDLEHFIGGDFLRVQALCYDVVTDAMLDVASGIHGEGNDLRIFYVNNNPLIAGPSHPVLVAALERATQALLHRPPGSRDIQAVTGPGNLTAALVQHSAELNLRAAPSDFEVLLNWGHVAISRWPLEYRDDGRNWRKWSRGDHLPQPKKVRQA